MRVSEFAGEILHYLHICIPVYGQVILIMSSFLLHILIFSFLPCLSQIASKLAPENVESS